MMKKYSVLGVTLVSLLISAILTSQAMPGVFHVTNATGFQNALNAAASNGEGDIIYLAAGTYGGHFFYGPLNPEHKTLTIQGEPGTSAKDIILDGQNSGFTVLYVYDIHDYTDGVVPEISIKGLTVQNGNPGYVGGGVIAILSSYNVSMTGCIVRNNKTTGRGGGVYVAIQSNSSGAIYLENNLIVNNIVTEYDTSHMSMGGGVSVYSKVPGTATLVITNNTIYGNKANNGGGVHIYGTDSAVYNNIIYGNTALQGGDIYFESIAGKNGFHNNYSSMYGAWVNSGSNLNTDPLFLDSTHNDFRLRSNSPMIDAGTATVPNPPGLPSTDLEGNLRVIGHAPDIGAYEYSPVSPDEGTSGTELEIKGAGYGKTKGKVLVGNVVTKILQWSDSLIQCQLTKAPPVGRYDVTIQPKGASPIVVHGSFSVVNPEISYVGPASGSTNDQITVYGSFFGTTKGKVALGGKTCRVTSWTMDATSGDSEVQFVVPRGLSAGTHPLQIKNSLGEDSVDFTVK